jgi:hypothetical protein
MNILPKYVLQEIYDKIPHREIGNIKNINKESKQYIESRTRTDILQAIKNIPSEKWYKFIETYPFKTDYITTEEKRLQNKKYFLSDILKIRVLQK